MAASPVPGRRVQVIGAGLPRTGTSSFCAAISTLLNGPAYHAGAQYAAAGADESHILTWIDVVERRPYRSVRERKEVLAKIHKQLDGFVATVDPPLTQLVPELMELFPDAKVLCSVRQPDAWADSIIKVIQLAANAENFLGLLFYWLPSVRHMSRLRKNLSKLSDELYGATIPPRLNDDARQIALELYNRHIAWLKEIVPAEKLFFVDVKDGWQPFCEALNVPIPQDVPFPQLNDGHEVEQVFKDLIRRGLISWAIAIGVGVAVVGIAIELRRWTYSP